MTALLRLTDMSWQEIRAAAESGAVAVLPTGSMEQHGPHLAVKTDTELVGAVAEAASIAVSAEVTVALTPVLWLGASHHHLPFFAMSVDETTYIEVVTQVASCLADAGFKRLFIINGHGGNSAPLRIALANVRRKWPELLVAAADYWSLAAAAIREIRSSKAGGVAHAGEFETSMMMHLHPDTVKADRLKPSIPAWPKGFTRDLVEGEPIALGIEWNRVSGEGTLGDPTQASAAKGERFFECVVASAAESLKTFARIDPESLRQAVGTVS